MKHRGLFVGLTTLDFIYVSEIYPQANQKVVAQDYLAAAGGPATNAAVAFSSFQNQGQLLTVLGQHPLTTLIKQDLADYSVELIDLLPEKKDIPSVSSIIVTSTTAERSVISLNAKKSQVSKEQIPEDILAGVDIVLIDGHQMEISSIIAASAKKQQIPVVIDGGSWKPGFETILPNVDYAICSANFYPPHCCQTQDVFDFLHQTNIDRIAITQGEKPILSCDRGKFATIPVPSVSAIDTLGAGDIFHGAFCHYILKEDFPTALSLAAMTASKSCEFFGTRSLFG